MHLANANIPLITNFETQSMIALECIQDANHTGERQIKSNENR